MVKRGGSGRAWLAARGSAAYVGWWEDWNCFFYIPQGRAGGERLKRHHDCSFIGISYAEPVGLDH